MRKVFNPFNTPLLTVIDDVKIDIAPRSEALLPPHIAAKLQEMHPGLEYPDGDFAEVKEEPKEEKKEPKKEPKLKAKKVTPKKNEKKRKK